MGANGPLRPVASEPAEAGDKQKAATPTATKGAAKAGAEDGTATPPWYEQISMAEDRDKVKDEQKRKEEQMSAQQERRRTAWHQEMQKQAEDNRRAREEERRRKEEAAEAERLRILQKLQVEREEEQRRQWEVQLMQ
eukprot:CAMPEP_0197914692 /NCGR_PEP_ID=MMETSP1439-20131203/78955_1 /TAXON_ID=66791 /ORGANISM="Gonyaulax spinifera, Strain CCMP409" /LENGTH=136 /DNA_ID=CAMNT_0043536617 /DNA_START=21 /DNA_END=428 /DNA_ORIENTATION=-